MIDVTSESVSRQQENGSQCNFLSAVSRAEELNDTVALKRTPSISSTFFLNETRPPQPFPFDALGSILGPAAKSIHEIVQAPDSICGNSLLAAASLAVQPYANVNVDGREIPSSLFLLSVAESGDRKSAVDSIALHAIKNRQKKLYDVYTSERFTFRNAYDAWDRKRQATINNGEEEDLEERLKMIGEEPIPPLKPLILIEEPTYEGLIKLLDVGQPSVGLFSDEGGRMFGGYGMDKNNLLKTSCGLSSLWDGRPASRVRGSEDFILLYGKRLSLHLMIQEVVLASVLSNPILTSQGLLARCLIVFPASMVGKREYQATNPFENAHVKAYLNRSASILDLPYVAEGKSKNILIPRQMNLHPSAKREWELFHNDIDKLSANQTYHPVRSTASKTPEQALRIAGSINLFENPEATHISSEDLEKGVALSKFYLDEYLRILNAHKMDPDLIQAQQVFEWMKRESEKGQALFPLCDICQRGPNSTRKVADARKMMKMLQDYELVAFFPDELVEGVRRKEVWLLTC